MNKKINYRELIGQRVVCYVPLTTVEEMERSAKVMTVTAVGTKYIKAGRREFDKHTLRCDNPFSALYIGTPEEFSKYIHLKLQIRKRMDRLTIQFGNLELYQLEQLNNMLNRIIEESE